MARAQRLIDSGRASECGVLLDSLLEVAHRRQDDALRLRVRLAQGIAANRTNRFADAEHLLLEVREQAFACGDTLTVLRASMWLGQSFQWRALYSRAESLYASAIPLAAAAGDAETEGFMRCSRAYIRLLAGKKAEARADYEKARDLLRRAGSRFGELDAMTGLGRVHHECGEVDSAAAAFSEVARLGREYGVPYEEANALNNLGEEEQVRGDPGAAIRAYESSAAAWRKVGNYDEAVAPALNAARLRAELGSLSEAEVAADSVLRWCHESGLLVGELMTLDLRMELREAAGDAHGLELAAQEILARGDQVSAGRRLKAWQAIASAKDLAGDPHAALEALVREAEPLRAAVSADFQTEYDRLHSRLLLHAGRAREAAMVADRAAVAAARLARTDLQVEFLTLAAGYRLHTGQYAEARALLSESEDAWERHRAKPSDPTWRERRSHAQDLYATIIAAHLDDPGRPEADRARAAFDAVRRFKARALLDRLSPLPGDSPIPPTTLDALQHSVLHDGELLIDTFEGPDNAYVFAVSRDSCRVIVLPDTRTLAREIRLFHGLLAASPHQHPSEARVAALDAAGHALAAQVLDPLGSLLGNARTVIWIPDGTLNLLPVEFLLARHRTPASTCRVPSAELFAHAREHWSGMSGRSGDLRGIAFAPASSRDAPLPHAAAEARAISRRFAGIELVSGTPTLRGLDIVHVAGHVELDDRFPWRSGIGLGSGEGLRGEAIARQSLPARLVVLSGCESAGGAVVPGEGLVGLSSAFMAAGVPAVVATLWPIEDESAHRLMIVFYDQLSRKRPAGEALRVATTTLAASPEYADPFYWAGYVLMGEPEVCLPLQRRHGLFVAGAAASAFLAAGGAGMVALRRKRTVISGPSGATQR